MFAFSSSLPAVAVLVVAVAAAEEEEEEEEEEDASTTFICRNSKNAWWCDRSIYTTIFKRVLGIARIKIAHLKGKNNWEGSGSLDSNELFKGTN